MLTKESLNRWLKLYVESKVVQPWHSGVCCGRPIVQCVKGNLFIKKRGALSGRCMTELVDIIN